MILSVSRRTDIPRFYFQWFLNRLKEGYVLVRNPLNFHQVSRIELTPKTIEFIVFWSKNPEPMLAHLEKLSPYPYYIQFTINAYGKDVEENLPEKKQLIETFRQLSDAIGVERMVWRYSPVLLSPTYTEKVQLDFFAEMCEALSGYTKKCNLSFIDMYSKIRAQMVAMKIVEPELEQKISLSQKFLQLAGAQDIRLGVCGNLEPEAAGLEKSCCIDAQLISKISGKTFKRKKDLNQRAECYCMPSVDIGAYDTCLNGCRYCYANHAFSKAENNLRRFNPDSPMLCGKLGPEDKVTERKINMEGTAQGELFPDFTVSQRENNK